MAEKIDPNTTPALAPPPGVIPNFDNPYSIGQHEVLASGLNIAISTLAIIIRLYTKGFILKNITHDDYVLIFSGLTNIPSAALLIAANFYGIGAHQWNVTIADVMYAVELANITEMLFCLAMASIKYAVLKQIQHIFCTPHRRDVRWWIIQINISVNFAFYFALIICLAAACIPREAIWNPLVPGTCLNYTALLIASPVVNLLSDMGMLIVPFMGIKRLGWSLKKKIAAGAVFSAGFLAIANCAIRIAYTVWESKQDDFTYTVTPVGILGETEIIFAVLCATLPFFPRFFRHLFRMDKEDPSSGSSEKTQSDSKDTLRRPSLRNKEVSSVEEEV